MRIAFALLLTQPLWYNPPAGQITPENVARLQVAWTYDTGEPIALFRKSPRFEATPVYADGKLYLSTPGGFVVALDAATGRELWKTDLHAARGRNYSDFANRGLTRANSAGSRRFSSASMVVRSANSPRSLRSSA
jgi:glucose dehydrogenase